MASNVPEWVAHYLEVTSGSKLLACPFAERLVVTGRDRTRFLQNLATNDVAALATGQNCEALFTNVKGHVLAHTLVRCREDDLQVYTFAAPAPALAEHLERYIVTEDVTLACDKSPIYFGFGENTLHGEATGLFGRAAWLVDPSNAKKGSEVCTAEQVFHSLRIEGGWPLAGIDFEEKALPQELSRNDRAISFNKGCYLGQETVARIDALGHVNKQFVGVKFCGDTSAEVGYNLVAGEQVVGKITSITYSPALEATLAVAMVRRGSNSPVTMLQTTAGEGEVIALPVASPS